MGQQFAYQATHTHKVVILFGISCKEVIALKVPAQTLSGFLTNLTLLFLVLFFFWV
jgi:hypothetical protein